MSTTDSLAAGRARLREGAATLFCCLLASAALLLLCTQSSLLYPTNTWADANCLLTVGRVMRAGGVLYRDIYEQKGPTLYLLHALAACISDTSFLGVFILEVVSLTAALTAACRLLRRRLSLPLSLAGGVLLGAAMLVSSAFAQGDSAEEFCLPLLLGALLIAVCEYEREAGPMRPSLLFVCGLLAGGVATIKYTMLGQFIGLCAVEGVLALRRGGFTRALRSAGVFLAGMAAPVVVWAAYFAASGALDDAFTAYIVNNTMLYDGGSSSMGWASLPGYLLRNALWILPAALGLLHTALRRDMSPAARAAVLAMAGGQLVAVCFLGRVWPYCPLALSVFSTLGFGILLAWGARYGRWFSRAALPLSAAAALALAFFASPNAPVRGVPYEETAQARLARYIEPGATLLQYSHLDDGLYLASGTLPQEKYFVRLNVNLPEMQEALDRYVEQSLPDYVLISWRPLPERFDRYQLIATDAGYDDASRINKMLYLYRRKSP